MVPGRCSELLRPHADHVLVAPKYRIRILHTVVVLSAPDVVHRVILGQAFAETRVVSGISCPTGCICIRKIKCHLVAEAGLPSCDLSTSRVFHPTHEQVWITTLRSDIFNNPGHKVNDTSIRNRTSQIEASLCRVDGNFVNFIKARIIIRVHLPPILVVLVLLAASTCLPHKSARLRHIRILQAPCLGRADRLHVELPHPLPGSHARYLPVS
mmetsp:Transcript_54359/g.145088  ORF Transcript_54359/g.145088 Transcript_54359/m.145088 type:complete len:212 (+) Transcript_54359:2762-3397(+)